MALPYLQSVRSYVEGAAEIQDGRLPPERALVSILGLTRNQIRSALKRLEGEGLIWRHVGKGTFVGPRPPEAVAQGNGLPRLEMINPRDVIEARLVIEPALARFAATRATAHEIRALGEELANLRRVMTPKNFKSFDRKWHAMLCGAGGNALLASFLELAHAQTDPNIWSRLEALYMSSDRMREAVDEHERILNAIRIRNPELAEEEMRAHILAVRSRIFGELA